MMCINCCYELRRTGPCDWYCDSCHTHYWAKPSPFGIQLERM